MVIKDNKLREKLWNLHFVDGLRKKEGVRCQVHRRGFGSDLQLQAAYVICCAA